MSDKADVMLIFQDHLFEAVRMPRRNLLGRLGFTTTKFYFDENKSAAVSVKYEDIVDLQQEFDDFGNPFTEIWFKPKNQEMEVLSVKESVGEVASYINRTIKELK